MSSVGRPKRDQRWARLLGQWIRAKRERILKISQGDLAKFVNVTRTTVSKWESGKVTAPTPKLVAVYELVKMVHAGVRDKQQLLAHLEKLTDLDIDAVLADLAKSAGMDD